jgi:LacI family transcriptional regulator
MAEQGQHAVRLLLRRIAGEPVVSEALRPDLVVRASTGVPVGPSLAEREDATPPRHPLIPVP